MSDCGSLLHFQQPYTELLYFWAYLQCYLILIKSSSDGVLNNADKVYKCYQTLCAEHFHDYV